MTYRNGKHLQKRGGQGRFERWTLQDFNLGSAVCPHCGSINPYDLTTAIEENGFVFMKRNEPPTACSHCKQALAIRPVAENVRIAAEIDIDNPRICLRCGWPMELTGDEEEVELEGGEVVLYAPIWMCVNPDCDEEE